MKILFSGAQGVGKSTIVNELAKVFPDYTILDNISLKFSQNKEDFKDPIKLKQFQTKLSLYALSKYISTDNFISARSIADIYAYSRYEYENSGDNRYKLFSDLVTDLVEDFNGDGYMNIFIPKMFELNNENNNLRSANAEFQSTINGYIAEFHQMTGLKYHQIKSLAINDRVKEVLKLIRGEN